VITLSLCWSIWNVCSSALSVVFTGPCFIIVSVGKLCNVARYSILNGAVLIILINVEVLHSAMSYLCVARFNDFSMFSRFCMFACS
jgi:hypothetical protein